MMALEERTQPARPAFLGLVLPDLAGFLFYLSALERFSI
jgi:hypothetical protein